MRFVSTLTTLEFVVYIAHAELRVYIEVSRFDRVEYLKRNMMSLAYMYDCKAFAILTFLISATPMHVQGNILTFYGLEVPVFDFALARTNCCCPFASGYC